MSKKTSRKPVLPEVLLHQTHELLANQLLDQARENKRSALAGRRSADDQMLYRKLVDNSDEGMLVIDDAGTIIFANKMAAKMLNSKKNEKLEGELFGFSTIENETVEIKIAAGNKIYNAEMRSRKIKWEDRWAQLVTLIPMSDQGKIKTSLQKTSSTLKGMISASPLAIILVDIGRVVSLWSAAATDIFGWTELETRGYPFPFDDSPLDETLECVLSGKQIDKTEISGQFGLYGLFKILNVWAVPLKGSNGLLNGVMLMIADITEAKLGQKKIEQALQASEERFRMSLRNSPISVSSQDSNLRYTWVYNPPFGLSESQMIGKTDGELFSPEDAAQLHELKNGVLKSNFKNRSEIKVQFEGKLYFYDISVEPIVDELGLPIGISCAATDISTLRHTESLAAFALHHDPLTGLPNRAVFRDRLQQALALAQRNNNPGFAVMHFGLDQFKMINQLFGHTLGDRLLLEVSKRIVGAIYEFDTVSHGGSDEFLILATHIRTSEDAACIVKKIVDAFQHPFFLNGQDVYLTSSIGIALFPSDGNTAHDLLRNSDVAMHRAKEEPGRGNYRFFSENMHSHTIKRFTIESDLRRGLEKEEFHLHYQPQVDINSNIIVGVEALVRWQHPEKGNIPPSEFIPVAESSGLIIPIGEWILHTACKQQKAWLDAGFAPVRMAVNISARQFLNDNLVNKVARAIESSGISPEYLELELTESMLMTDKKNTEISLHILKQMGVRLSIDDFGTGYSSLSYLQHFPLDVLKIDQSFVCGLGSAENKGEIALAIIALAHALGLEVVAEGVENQQQLDFLHNAGCKFAQGYFLGKPLPPEKCANLLKSKSIGLFLVSDRTSAA